MANIRRERFLKIASNRTNKVLEDLRMLENCSNTNNYEYSEEDVNKMFDALQAALDSARTKFGGKKKERFKF